MRDANIGRGFRIRGPLEREGLPKVVTRYHSSEPLSEMAERQRKKKSPPSGDEDDNSPKSQTENPTSLQFLTFTHVDQTTDPETKRRVRSHVMHGVQQKLRSGKGREKGNILLDISPLSQSYGESSLALAPVPFPRLGTLGSGQSDPFKSYPIEMDVRSHELYDHCKNLIHE